MKHVDTILLVEDIQRSKQFYVDIIGLEILHDWDAMVIFKNRFALHQADRLLPEQNAESLFRKGAQGCGNVVVYFEVEDLQGAFDRMQAQGVEIAHGIVALPWQKIFRAYDPDRHILEIGEPFSQETV